MESGSILVSNIMNLTIQCPEESYPKEGCKFCIIRVPCGCSVSGSDMYISPRIIGCDNNTKSMSKLHPVNLAVLQNFFQPQELEAITGDSLFDSPVQITIPEFKIFKHNFSEIVAGDQKHHLSLQRAAAAAKADDYIFQTLADPILDGRLPELDTIWSIIIKYLSMATASVTAVLGLIVVWQLYKIRSLTIAVAILQKSTTSSAIVHTHPPLLYNEHDNVATEKPSMEILESAETYDNLAYLALVLAFAGLIFYVIRKVRNCKTTLILEVTTGSSCVRIPTLSIPNCPKSVHCTALETVKSIDINRGILPSIRIDWGDLVVANTGLPVKLPKLLRANPWNAFKLRQILKQKFVVQLLLVHKSLAIPATICHPDTCNCKIQPTAPLYPSLLATDP